jgi:hypothetical protein
VNLSKKNGLMSLGLSMREMNYAASMFSAQAILGFSKCHMPNYVSYCSLNFYLKVGKLATVNKFKGKSMEDSETIIKDEPSPVQKKPKKKIFDQSLRSLSPTCFSRLH